MRHRWVYVDGVAYEVTETPAVETHHVIPDIEPFRDPSGAFISGRRAWREHLKRTDTIELSHSDMKAAQVQWNKRKEAHREKLKGAVQTVQKWDQPTGEIRPVNRSNLMVEMANRLHGRPIPERKEMLKLTLDIAKRMNK